jgi:hypothetical protein
MTEDFVMVKGESIPCKIVEEHRDDNLVEIIISIWDWPWKEEINYSTWGVESWHKIKFVRLVVNPTDILKYKNPLLK